MDIKIFEKILSKYPKFRLKQAKKHLYKDLITDWSDSTVLPNRLKEELNSKVSLRVKANTYKSKKKDTVKALIELEDGMYIETVLMKHQDGRNTVCVSSQVGCPLGCSFCATGKMGFKRNLNTWEIVEQVLFFARLLKEKKEKVSNVVFMGMGEPFLNYDIVLEAVRILNDGEGFKLGARNISISTAGVIEGINRLREESLQINLAVSLHAPNNEIRSYLMKINEKYPLEDLLNAVSEYVKKTRRKVMFEYMLVRNINDSEENARDLASIMKNRLYVVNLIFYNPTSGSLRSSSAKRVERFREILEQEGVKVTQRFSFGQDIKGACGQLAGKL